MITLTDNAVQELKSLLQRKFAAPDEGLICTIERGGWQDAIHHED